MSGKLTTELEVKAGNSSAAVNAIAKEIRTALAPLEQMNKAGRNLAHALEPALALAEGLVVALGVEKGFEFFSEGTKGAMEYGERLEHLHERTGGAISDLAVMEQAFKNSELPIEGVGQAINKMQKALQGFNDEGDPTNDIFNRLHLNMAELKRMNPVQQFEAVGKAINSLEDPSQRTAAAMAIWGKKGGEMLQLIANPEAMATAAMQVGSQAGILEKDAALFAEVTDELNTAGLKLQGFFVGFADTVAPIIEPLTKLFSETDFAGAGQAFGMSLAASIMGLMDGSIWRIYADSAMIVVGGLVDYLFRGMGAVVGFAGGALVALFKLALATFDVLLTPAYWEAMGRQLLSWIDKFGALFYGLMGGLVQMLQPILDKIPGMGGVGKKASDFLGDQAAKMNAAGDKQSAMAYSISAPSREETGKKIMEALNEAPKWAGKFWDNFSAVQTNIDALQEHMDQSQWALMGKEEAARNAAYAGTKKPYGQGADLQPMEKISSLVMGSIGGFGVFQKDVLARDPLISIGETQRDIQQKILDAVIDQKARKMAGAEERFAFNPGY